MIKYIVSCVTWENVEDIVYVVIGAILGMIASLIIAWGAKRYGIDRLKKMLRVELDGIKSGVKKKINSPDELVLNSPIWNFLGQTSTLLDLKEKDYKTVVAIHGAILDFKENEKDAPHRNVEERQAFIDKLNKYSF